MLSKLTPIALWKRFFDWHHSRFCRRSDRRAAADPRWAEIEELRRAHSTPGATAVLDSAAGLTLELFIEQLDIASSITPHTWAHRLDWWLDRHRGVSHPFRTFSAFWLRGRYGWAPRDTYNLSHHLSGVIAGSVAHFRDSLVSHPMGMASEEWSDILSTIERGFRAHSTGAPVFDTAADREAAVARLLVDSPAHASDLGTSDPADPDFVAALDERLVDDQFAAALELFTRWYRHLWN